MYYHRLLMSRTDVRLIPSFVKNIMKLSEVLFRHIFCYNKLETRVETRIQREHLIFH